MGGKHAVVDRRRLFREMLRLILSIVVLLVILVAAALGVSSWLGSSDDVIPVVATDNETTTSVLAATLATTAPSEPSTTTTTTTTVAPSTTTSTVPPVRGPAEITVIVLNSTDTKGMAARLTIKLANLGYLTVEADNYAPALDISVVWFADGYRREAELLAEQVPDATIEPFAEDDVRADITVVLGSSFSE